MLVLAARRCYGHDWSRPSRGRHNTAQRSTTRGGAFRSSAQQPGRQRDERTLTVCSDSGKPSGRMAPRGANKTHAEGRNRQGTASSRRRDGQRLEPRDWRSRHGSRVQGRTFRRGVARACELPLALPWRPAAARAVRTVATPPPTPPPPPPPPQPPRGATSDATCAGPHRATPPRTDPPQASHHAQTYVPSTGATSRIAGPRFTASVPQWQDTAASGGPPPPPPHRAAPRSAGHGGPAARLGFIGAPADGDWRQTRPAQPEHPNRPPRTCALCT
ncbi:translation initiation factor IF-2-like [Schistocerca piceifrons]|uniref:translation initiation factor IF-2-like n=1 Tax=Schistocerca piceifrons TaxID=274613 RepID=UPI001F5EA2B6|nr:translation initiation factor IF-2-like [Schistocerca piceifrons]